MARLSQLSHLDSSKILGDKGEWNADTHFQWQSIKNFIGIAAVMSSSAFNFDLFSKIASNATIFEFFILQSTIGISYLCMDSFIKLYTGRYDCHRYLNPLLRGISFGQFVQTGYMSLIHGSFIADTIQFFVGGIKEVPSWAICGKDVNIACVPIEEIVLRCRQNQTTGFRNTSVFFYYMSYFTQSGNRFIMTSRLFETAIVWLLTFLLSSASDETLVKIFSLTNGIKETTTIVSIAYLLFSTNNEARIAFSDIVNVTAGGSWALSMKQVAYTYGIGFLGIHDYGQTSPYTTVDTASILFMIMFTFSALMRSWIIKILYLGMIKCVVIDESYEITTHNLFYAVLPLCTEFFQVRKLYAWFLLGNLAITLMSFEMFLISTMSKFLQYEFRNVKQIYIVGMVCASGFGITIALTGISTLYGKRLQLAAGERGIGIDISVLYLSGFRVAIIMWFYGVKTFATDIYFWLGFHPVRFWTVSWALLPLALFGLLINKVLYEVYKPERLEYRDLILISVTVFLVTSIQIKTIAGYLMKNRIQRLLTANFHSGFKSFSDLLLRKIFLLCFKIDCCEVISKHQKYLIAGNTKQIFINIGENATTSAPTQLRNIVGVFVAHKQYGPPNPEDQKRRQLYHEGLRQRKCIHNCMAIDEWFDCDHEPLMEIKTSEVIEIPEEQILSQVNSLRFP